MSCLGGVMKSTQQMLGERIKELRKAKGLSQNSLSEKVDIETKHLSRIEVGKSYPSLDTLQRIAKALEADLKDFFDFTPEMTREQCLKRISTLLKNASSSELSLILRLIKTITQSS